MPGERPALVEPKRRRLEEPAVEDEAYPPRPVFEDDFVMPEIEQGRAMVDEEVVAEEVMEPVPQNKERAKPKRRRIEPQALMLDSQGPELVMTQMMPLFDDSDKEDDQQSEITQDTHLYLQYLNEEFEQRGISSLSRRAITFQQTIEHFTARQASKRFLNLLLLVTSGTITAKQSEPFGDIYLRPLRGSL